MSKSGIFEIHDPAFVWENDQWHSGSARCNHFLRQRTCCAREISNTALFLRLGPPFTLIRHEARRNFWKLSSNRRNLKTVAWRFSVNRKHFENGAFRKRWRHDNHVIFLIEFSPNVNPKWPPIVCVSKFLRRSVDGKHLMRFRWKAFFNIPQRCVDGVSGSCSPGPGCSNAG